MIVGPIELSLLPPIAEKFGRYTQRLCAEAKSARYAVSAKVQKRRPQRPAIKSRRAGQAAFPQAL